MPIRCIGPASTRTGTCNAPECHSTGLRKGYDAETNGYKTTWHELNVSCEACHGPASSHTDWARKASKPYKADENKGFTLPTASRWQEAWKFPEVGARYARRDRPADPAVNNTCAACHARRSTLAPRDQPGAPLDETHRLAVLTAQNTTPMASSAMRSTTGAPSCRARCTSTA